MSATPAPAARAFVSFTPVGMSSRLSPTALFINRELSWLEFNARVLHEATDARVPLLERLKFAAIFSSNLDEFFQVRVAGLRRQVAAGVSERTADGMQPEEQLTAISLLVDELVQRHRECLVGTRHEPALGNEPALGDVERLVSSPTRQV